MFGWLVGQLVGRSVGWLVGCSAWYVSSIFMSITSCYLPNNPTVYRLLFLFYRGSNKTNAYPKAHCWCLDRVQKAWVANGYRQGSSAHKLPAPNVHQEIQREKAGPHQSWALPEKTHRRKATGNLPSASCHIALCCPDLQAPWHEETPLPSHNLLWDWLDNSSKVLWREVMEETPCICVWVDSQGSSDEFKANEWVCSDYWAALYEKGIVFQHKSPTGAAKITQLYSTPKHVFFQLGCHTRKRKRIRSIQPQTGPWNVDIKVCL